MASDVFKIGVLVSGRGTNLQAIIDQISCGHIPAKIEIILSNKKDAPALDRGKSHGIKSIFVNPKNFNSKSDFDLALVAELKKHKVDLICLAGYMKILGKEFIQSFPNKIINIHPSLLPAFPGLNVQQKAIDYGVKFSGCTVHYVNEEVDSGPIILQAVVPVLDNDNEESLANRILEQEHKIYPEAIKLIAEKKIKIINRKVNFQ